MAPALYSRSLGACILADLAKMRQACDNAEAWPKCIGLVIVQRCSLNVLRLYGVQRCGCLQQCLTDPTLNSRDRCVCIDVDQKADQQ